MLEPRPPHPERGTPTPGGHYSPPRGYASNPTPQHHTPKQAGSTERPQLSKRDLLSTQALASFIEAMLNVVFGYQALQLSNPQHALHHTREQIARAWAQRGGRPTSFHKEAIISQWRYYRDKTGILVDRP